MTDAQLRAWHEMFAVGDRVRHYGTKQWGAVIEVRPVSYGVELVVDHVDGDADSTVRHYWEGSRIDQHRRAGERAVRFP